jgi:hypothetical protein
MQSAEQATALCPESCHPMKELTVGVDPRVALTVQEAAQILAALGLSIQTAEIKNAARRSFYFGSTYVIEPARRMAGSGGELLATAGSVRRRAG